MQPVCVLTIAGSDSGGGAGIEADLRTFASLGVHGCVAITAITAQNTYEVRAVAALEAEMVRTQVETVSDDLSIRATKTGMLARPATVVEVGALAREGRLGLLVVDPVLVTSSGHPLMEHGGIEAYRSALLPYATVATPNLLEACALVDLDPRTIHSVDDMVGVAQGVLDFGPQVVLVKGGHYAGTHAETTPDVIVSSSGVVILESARVVTSNDHGTGCSLAAAITARLALGDTVHDAISFAKTYVWRALVGAAPWQLGKGHGPIDHLGWNSQ